MSKRFLIILSLILCLHPLYAKVILVDDFEDGSVEVNPPWWSFGNLNLTVDATDKEEFSALGQKRLRLRGFSERWYVGGAGLFKPLHLKGCNAIKLLVRGYGPKSGRLTIELFDDDNQNWAIEPHPNHPSSLKADDKFTYSFDITWSGWRVVIIPFKDFSDANVDIGDNIFNAYQKNGSGGLMQIQFIAVSAEEEGLFRADIDSIKFFRMKKKIIEKELSREDWF